MFEDRWYQTGAVDALFNYFATGGRGNPLVALPTGTGKSVVIARFLQRALSQYPTTRALMLTHVKELIKQNADKLQSVWHNAPLGIHSAGLNQRDVFFPIIYGGVKSVANKIDEFGHIDLLLIDEAHLLSDNAVAKYNEIILKLKLINPWLKVIGFTATPYRMGQGSLTNGEIFTDIVYDCTQMAVFNRLISEGFLCPLVPRRTTTQLDVSRVGMMNGEFNLSQLASAVDQDEITYKCLREVVETGRNEQRRSWLIFASGVDHSDHIAQALQFFGVSAVSIHSKRPEAERERDLERWKAGEVEAAVNNNVLTTGIDHPPLDLIGVLRPTMSTVLWVQMLGRGTRPFAGKKDCRVLDFAGNTPRLGPINDPVVPRKKGDEKGQAPVRLCEMCGVYNHASLRQCSACGHEFTIEGGPEKLFAQAGTQELIRTDLPQTEVFNVDQVLYGLHTKAGSPDSIKVSYVCGVRRFNEWVCFEHKGFPGKRAREWWRQRHKLEPPDTTAQALQVISELRAPKQIRVWVNRKYPEVLGAEF